MGNNPTYEEHATVHSLFGEPRELTYRNGEKTHVVDFAVADEDQGKRFISNFNITDGFSKRHLLLSNRFSLNDATLCGNSKHLSVFFSLSKCVFPFYPYSLQQEIDRRALQKMYLSKQELTYLIYQIIDGARNFDRFNEKVGDIRPALILLDEGKRWVKLVNHWTAPGHLTGLERAIDLKERVLLAPEQLKALQRSNPVPDINVHKADSFSLGLTILSIGNLKRMQNVLYNWSIHSFQWTELSTQLQNFQNRYGHLLGEMVKGFLQNQPRNRLYIGEIGVLLQSYEKQIYEMIDFEPDFGLLERTYELNYSGPRSEGFLKWLHNLRDYYGKKIPVKQVVLDPPVILKPPIILNPAIIEPPKVVNPPIIVNPALIEKHVIVKPHVVVNPKVVVNPPVVVKPPVVVNPAVLIKPSLINSSVTEVAKLKNSRIQFYYTSPGVVKRVPL